MKKLMMIAAMMLMSIGAFAQNEVGQFTLKPMAGVNLSVVTKFQESKMRVGAVVGAEGEYGIAKNFSVTAGLQYSMQGAKEVYGKSFKLDYINVPILANYYVIPGLAIKVGMQPSFKVSSDITLQGENGEPYNPNGFYFSVPAGVSYEYSNFVVDARYCFGISPICSPGDSKHNWVSITLGYKFPL